MLSSHSNNYFHVLTNIGLAQTTFSSAKMRHVIGIDWNQVYFDQTNTKFAQQNGKNNNATTKTSKQQIDHLSRWLRQHLSPKRDICHLLALETNGSVFNHLALKQDKYNISTFKVKQL